MYHTRRHPTRSAALFGGAFPDAYQAHAMNEGFRRLGLL